MPHEHHFALRLDWTGSSNGPTTDYNSYSREIRAEVPGKPPFMVTADPAFRGDASVVNPEDLLVAAVSACHCLSYLALCARRGVLVTGYSDDATAIMKIRDGKMRIVEAVLRPRVTIAKGDAEYAHKLHHEAHEVCFIASSVNFEIRVEAVETLVGANDSAPESVVP